MNDKDASRIAESLDKILHSLRTVEKVVCVEGEGQKFIVQSLDEIAKYLRCIAVCKGIDTMYTCIERKDKKLAGLVFDLLPLDRQESEEDIIA